MCWRAFKRGTPLVFIAAVVLSSASLAQKTPPGVPAQTGTNNPPPPQTPVPAPGSTPAAPVKSTGAAPEKGPKSASVNINTASTEDLHKLPGMTSQRVAAIMRGRPYGKVDELVERRILKSSTLDRIRPYISAE